MTAVILTDEEIEYARGQYTPLSEMAKAINTIDAKNEELSIIHIALESLIRGLAFYTFQSQHEMDHPGEWENRMTGTWGGRAIIAMTPVPEEVQDEYRLKKEIVEAAEEWNLTRLENAVEALKSHRSKPKSIAPVWLGDDRTQHFQNVERKV